jgi:hypothetical protein
MVSRRFFTLFLCLIITTLACQLGEVVDSQDSPAATAVPLSTATPTLLPTTLAQSPGTRMPDLAGLILPLDALPAGYEIASESMIPQVGGLLNMNMEIRSSFSYATEESEEVVLGITTLLPTRFTQNDFDLSLHTQQFRRRLFDSDMESMIVPGEETIADASVQYAALYERGTAGVQFDCVAFRREIVGAIICYSYPTNREAQLSAIELAAQLDQEIILYLENR